MVVENNNKTEEPPKISKPNNPQQIEEGPKAHPEPVAANYFLQIHNQLFHRIDYSLESLRIIHSEVGENLAVQTYILFCELAHKLGIRHSVLAGSCVYPLNPQCAEFAFFNLTVAVSVCETFLVGVLRYRPDIFP